MSTPGLQRPAPTPPATLDALSRRPVRDLLVEVVEHVVLVVWVFGVLGQADLLGALGVQTAGSMLTRPLALVAGVLVIAAISFGCRRVRVTEPRRPGTREGMVVAAALVVLLASLVMLMWRADGPLWQLHVSAMVAVGVTGAALKVIFWRRPLPRAQPRHDPLLDHDGPARVLAALAGVSSYRADALRDRLGVDEPTLVAWHRQLVDVGYATSHLRGVRPWLDATGLGRTALTEHLTAVRARP
ncbi:hypothetical protein [Janibacter melonis]|uniref:hypothetical protein n=1 Tax=Janibacter melonis TaxID=262209 RepID=UPI00191B39AB|nr:hypothetical protein [Janibacter melonis]